MSILKLELKKRWDGGWAPENEHVHVALDGGPLGLCFELDAPFHGDAPPPHPPGSTPELWNYEVVELFLFGDGERYLEVELGPFGHHLVLELEGVRRVVREVSDFDYPAPRIVKQRWHASALIPLALVPPRATHVNVHAVHGSGLERRYLSLGPSAGERPDFHRKDAAIALDEALLRALRR